MLGPLDALAKELSDLEWQISGNQLDIEGAWARYNEDKKEFAIESASTRRSKKYSARRLGDIAGVMRRFHLQAVHKRIERAACVALAKEKMAARLAKVKAKCPGMAVTVKGVKIYVNDLLVVDDHVTLNVPLHMIQEIWRTVH